MTFAIQITGKCGPLLPVLALVTAGSAWAQQAPMAVYPGDPAKRTASQAPLPPGFMLSESRPDPVSLPPLSQTTQDAGTSMPQAGVRRSVPSGLFGAATEVPLSDGRNVRRATVVSPGAAGVRLHFSNFHVANGEVWVYGAAGVNGGPYIEGPYTQDGIYGDGDFWTGIVPGSEVTVELVQNGPLQARSPPFEIRSLSHLWGDALGLSTLSKSAGAPGAVPRAVAGCHVDVSCYPSNQFQAKGVVMLVYEKSDGRSYVCTGSMVNTRASAFIPYVLTANHCISTEAEARSVTALFFYESSSCNGPPPSLFTLPAIAGATFLAGAGVGEGDWSFLRLSANAPAGTTFLGWTTQAPSFGESVTGIHHPDGSWKRISFGSRTVDADVNVIGLGFAPADRYFRALWTLGVTEPGASGSPLLNDAGQIIGTLTGVPPGDNACSVSPNIASYGRFSNAYAALSPYLNETLPTLGVNPGALNFTVANGQYIGDSQQSLSISTSSAAAIAYNITTSAPWIQLSQTSGSVSASAAASVMVSIDPSFFPTSTNALGTITVSSGGLVPATVLVRANITIAPASITIASVLNGASFQSGLSPGQWVTIQGANLANVTRTLAPIDGRFPTFADGVSVMVNGQPAFLEYLSPTQLNVISPDLAVSSFAIVTVTNNGNSASLAAVLRSVSPAAFEWPGRYAVATDLAYQLKIRNGIFPGISTTPARPGEIITLWTTGLGSTNPPVEAGSVTPSGLLHVPTRTPRVFVGPVEAEGIGAALAPGYASLFQISIRVPDLPDGDYALSIDVDGARSPAGTLLTILR